MSKPIISHTSFVTALPLRLCRTHPISRIAPPFRTPHRPLQATLIPPSVTIPLIAITAASPRLPPALQNTPTAFILSLTLSNLGLLPSQSTLYDTLIGLAPYAVALLLISPLPPSSSTTSFRPPRPLLLPFVIGALGTLAGALLAPVALHLVALPSIPALPTLCAAFAATYIGGSANFVAVANALQLPSYLTVAAFAVDLVAMAIYFAALFALAARAPPPENTTHSQVDSSSSPTRKETILGMIPPVAIVTMLAFIVRATVTHFSLPASAELLLTAGVAIALRRVQALRGMLRSTDRAATLALNVLFAAFGASARLGAVAAASPSVIAIAMTTLAVHILVLYVFGHHIFRIGLPELLLSSNANIGGASTAAAFAAACGWRAYIPSSIAVGSLGYLIGTPIGLLVFKLLGGTVGT